MRALHAAFRDGRDGPRPVGARNDGSVNVARIRPRHTVTAGPALCNGASRRASAFGPHTGVVDACRRPPDKPRALPSIGTASASRRRDFDQRPRIGVARDSTPDVTKPTLPNQALISIPQPIRTIALSTHRPQNRHASAADFAAPPRPLNDRFKRCTHYSGTVVISITRSGRRPWPGQYALPYIR